MGRSHSLLFATLSTLACLLTTAPVLVAGCSSEDASGASSGGNADANESTGESDGSRTDGGASASADADPDAGADADAGRSDATASDWPNEPSGSTILTQRSFSASGEDGWLTPIGEFSITSDPSAPKSPGNVGQVRYPAGFAGGSEPARLEKSFSQSFSTQYVSFWIKLSPSFVGHPTGVNKILHFWVAGGNRIYLTAQGTGTGALLAQVNLQGVPVVGATNLPPNVVQGAEIVRNQWHRWEIVTRVNTPGAADGLIEWWIDGIKVASYPGTQLVAAGENDTFELIQWAPTWGGIGGTVPADQYMWIDHLYVSGR